MNAFKSNRGQLNIKSILFYTIIAIFCVAVCVVLFCMNITPSVALEQELRCGIEAHVHTDECYEGDFIVCKKSAHTHNGNCYIILLKENDINGILTMLGNNDVHSLEYVITDVMSSALTFNSNLNTSDDSDSGDLELSQDTVAQLNDTISDEDTLPKLVLNENINNSSTLSLEDSSAATQNATQNNAVTLSVGDEPDTSNYVANFYIYLDGKWTCIGSLPFTTARNGTRYNSTIPTYDVLSLVNSTLGTEYEYNSFDIAVSSSENGSYSKSNIGIASVTTTIGYRQTSSNSRAAKHIRLIPEGGSASSTSFAFYTVKYIYPEGTTVTEYIRSGQEIVLPSGNYEWIANDNIYSADETVTITGTTTFEGRLLGPPTYVNINYDVAFPNVSGVTVSTSPTLAGLATTTVKDEYSENSAAVIRNVSQQSVQGTVNGNGTGLTRVIQFRGWRVGDTDTILQPNTHLVWEELLQYSNNSVSLKLTAVWDYSPLQTASFFIRFDSVAVDTEGNVTGQDSNKYTNQIFAAYVGGVDTSLSSSRLQGLYGIADTTSDNSFGADQEIRKLYGERTDGVWLSAFPTDDFVFASLVQYANTGYLSVGGEAVKAEDLNDREYAIRWYVFKSQDDAWHIDGKLVKKEGLIHVYKTFAGNKELVLEAKTDFYINAKDVSTGENTVLDLNNYKSYKADTDTYMWEIADVDYGEYWEIEEHPHKFEDDSVDFSVYSEFTVMDAHGDQSITGTETSLPIGESSTHCVLAGHTGLPSAKLLTNIDHLKIGDRFYIHVLNEVLEYQIDDISVVEPDEVSRLNVISGKDYVTLVTCTPYGVNSHRLLVRGVRVSENDNLSANTDNVVNELLNIDMKYLLTFSLIGLCIAFIAVRKLIFIRKKNKTEKVMVVMLRMKQIIKRCVAVISVIIILLCVALPCLAASLKGTATIKLESDDEIIFVDIYGASHRYIVEEKLLLDGTAVTDMKAGEWDFTLFTCTKSGKQRVTLRCEKKE